MLPGVIVNEEKPLAAEETGMPTDASTPSATPDAVPPVNAEEEWPTHGGYLGCLIAIMFGCLFAAFFASPLVQGAYRTTHGAGIGYGPTLNVAAIVIMIAGLIAFGRIGWAIGKRVFREYAPHERTQPKAAKGIRDS